MKNKILILIIVIIIIIIGLAYYLNRPSEITLEKSFDATEITESVGEKGIVVEVNDFKFIPNIVTINKGDTVTWVNKDMATHRVIMGDMVLSDMKTGESSSRKFESSGSVNYYCEPHPAMKGLIIVK